MSDSEVQVKISADSSSLKTGTNDAKNAISDLTNGIKSATNGAADATKSSMDKISFATAGATREFIVLGHEALTGNFSRIPGSLMVLAERVGGLHHLIEDLGVATLGWAAAIGAAVYATYEWAAASEHLAQTQQQVRGALELNNQGASYSKEAINQQIESLRKLADVSKSEAQEIVVAFARAGDISVDLKNKLIGLVGDYAAATGKDAAKATEDLIKMFSDPQKGARELAETFKGILSPAQLLVIENFAKNGDAVKAQETLFDDLAGRIKNFREQHLGPLASALEGIKNLFIDLGNVKPFPAFAIGAPAPAATTGKGPDQNAQIVAYQEHQREINALIQQGYDTEQKSGLLIARKNDLLARQEVLIKAANAAAAQGDTKTESRFRADAAEIQKEINALKEKGSDEALKKAREHDKLQEQMVARDKLYAEDSIKTEQEKNQELLDLNQITNAQFLQRKLALQQELDAIDLQAAVDKQKAIQHDVVAYERAGNDIIALRQKQAIEEEKIRHQIVLENQKDYQQMAADINQSFEDSVRGVVNGSKSMSQAFKSFANSVIDDIARIAEKNIIQSLFGVGAGAGGLGGGLGGLVAGLFSGGAAQTSIAGLPWLAGARAGGGGVDSGKGYVIGENGPEIFVPSSNGTVLNQQQAGALGGTNITMNINTPDAQSFRQNTGQMMADMQAALIRSRRNTR